MATAQATGTGLEIADAVFRVNEQQKALVAEKIVSHFESQVSGRRIAVWGLSFKPGTDDVRESLALQKSPWTV